MRRLITSLAMLGALGAGGLFLYQGIATQKINVNSWFVGGMVRGVDVSSYQIDVDFHKLSELGIDFAYIKATEGNNHVDTSFIQKWQEAKEAGISAGAYHYFSYGSSGAEQAENFIQTVGDLKGSLIPALDLELTTEEVQNPPQKDDVVRAVKSFLAIVEEEYGVKPLLYSRQDYYQKYLADDFADYPRWITNIFFPVFMEAGDNWYVWQYSMHGIFDGAYSGEKYIDLNVLNRKITLEDLRIK